MSRADAERTLIEASRDPNKLLPPVDSKLVAHTVVLDEPFDLDHYLTAIEQLADERWAVASLSVGVLQHGGVRFVVVCRRVPVRQQGMGIAVPVPPPGGGFLRPVQ